MKDIGYENDVLILLYRMMRLFHLDIGEKNNITPLEFQVGMILCDDEKEKKEAPITASELASRVHIAPSSLTRILNKLEKQNYIHRTIPSENRRIVLITLSEEARKEFHKMHQVLLSYMREMMNRLGKEDTSSFICLLQKFRKVLEEVKKERKARSLCCN